MTWAKNRRQTANLFLDKYFAIGGRTRFQPILLRKLFPVVGLRQTPMLDDYPTGTLEV